MHLCTTFVRTVNVPGRDGDGDLGLSLLVTPRKPGSFSKTWAQAHLVTDWVYHMLSVFQLRLWLTKTQRIHTEPWREFKGRGSGSRPSSG